MRFGEYLVGKKVIGVIQLNEALKVQDFTNKKLGRILRELGFLSKDQLNNNLTVFFKSQKSSFDLAMAKKLQGSHEDKMIRECIHVSLG